MFEPPELEAVRGSGHFRWNRGGWFGTQLGGSAWLLTGAVALALNAPVAALLWSFCFVVANFIGTLLWRRRHILRPHTALQLLLMVSGLLGLVAVCVLQLLVPNMAVTIPALAWDSRYALSRYFSIPR